MQKKSKIAVVIPCYRVKNQILDVLNRIGPEVSTIYVIDDECPQHSGAYVQEHCKDDRVRVLTHSKNKGVGGATMSGIKAALSDKAGIIVKVDGDGQIDPKLIPSLIHPIVCTDADYAKGNRFYNLNISTMPYIRTFGNLCLSFFTKLSSGYWHIFDPTNGFFAIHGGVATLLDFDRIDERYFFESDLLFHLNLLGVVIADVPMTAKYADEISSLVVSRELVNFLIKNSRNLIKRIIYNYFLRDFNTGSISLIGGLILVIFSCIFGGLKWYTSIQSGVPATAGTVMLAAFPLICGINLLVSFLSFDISSKNDIPLQRKLIR